MTTSFKVYPCGESPVKYVPGDFILVSTNGILAKLIRLGQFIRYHGKMRPFARWNHTAMIINDSGDIIEAIGRGVVINNISDYNDVEYYYVTSKLNKQSRDQAVAAANSFLKDKYSWVTIFSIAIELLTGIKIQLTQSNTMICSALVGQSLWAGGIIFDSNPYQMMPADLACAFDIKIEKSLTESFS
jgi:hypothetical protein